MLLLALGTSHLFMLSPHYYLILFFSLYVADRKVKVVVTIGYKIKMYLFIKFLPETFQSVPYL